MTDKRALEGGYADFWGNDIDSPEDNAWAEEANIILAQRSKLKMLTRALKGGAGSGNFGHQGIPGHVGGSASGGGRVWGGAQHLAAAGPSESGAGQARLQTGQIGEKLAMRVLSEKLGVPFETLNVGINNAPIDVGGDHTAVEVKTGLATNGPTAQHWRAMISKPGKKEQALMDQMTKDEKKAYLKYKDQQTLQRKNDMLKQLTEIAGSEVKPLTVGVILSADGKRGDVYMIPGFHLRLPWKAYATDEFYQGSYDV